MLHISLTILQSANMCSMVSKSSVQNEHIGESVTLILNKKLLQGIIL